MWVKSSAASMKYIDNPYHSIYCKAIAINMIKAKLIHSNLQILQPEWRLSEKVTLKGLNLESL